MTTIIVEAIASILAIVEALTAKLMATGYTRAEVEAAVAKERKAQADALASAEAKERAIVEGGTSPGLASVAEARATFIGALAGPTTSGKPK